MGWWDDVKGFLFGEEGSRYSPEPYNLYSNRALSSQAQDFGQAWGERMRGEAQGARERDAGQYWGEQQRSFGEALRSAAEGGTPSAAELQMRAGLGRSQATARSMAAGMRGVSPGLANYLASRQMGEQQANIMQQTGILRAQEQATARDAYAQFMSGARGQDIGTQQMQEELAQKYMQMGMSAEQASIASRIGLEGMRQEAWATQEAIKGGSYEPGKPGYFANSMAALASVLPMMVSDRREKKDIKKAKEKDIRKFADALAKRSYSFRYKKDAPTSDQSKKKKHFGVMAQDLEKFGGAVGKSIVETYKEPSMPARKAEPGREVKALDLQAGFGAALAAIGDLAGRVKALEKG